MHQTEGCSIKAEGKAVIRLMYSWNTNTRTHTNTHNHCVFLLEYDVYSSILSQTQS